MELSSEKLDLLGKLQHTSSPMEDSGYGDTNTHAGKYHSNCDDLIHVDELEFSDDESWLCRPSVHVNKVQDLHLWLKDLNSDDVENELANGDIRKTIDSRTFTRPKKRFSRPSLERYNEELLKIKDNNNTYSYILAAKLQEIELEQDSPINSDAENTKLETPKKPLTFDLSQPTNSGMFDSILRTSSDMDSFQNMSPPSLVNSMCSSTFTNLMENSYIKNDPVLREIRDTDYSETILLHDGDPPLFQSFTESCSSLNSETPESFLRKTLNETYTNASGTEDSLVRHMENMKIGDDSSKSVSGSESSLVTNNTYKLSSTDFTSDDFCKSEDTPPQKHTNLTDILESVGIQNIDPNSTVILSTSPQLNGTYKKGSKLFSPVKSAMSLSNDSLNLDTHVNNATLSNATYNRLELRARKSQRNSVLGSAEINLNNTITLDSFENKRQNSSYEDVNHRTALKRNSFGYSAGSADSLDRMSSLSNGSSKGSNRMLNMAEVDAIVEMQEQSLQIMSTPKPSNQPRKIPDPLHLSPIGATIERSDSDLSSNDDYTTVRSKISPATSDPEMLSCDSDKYSKSSTNLAAAPRQYVKSVHMMTKPKPSYIRGSLTNLRNVGANLKGSYTNLKSVSTNVRGSYTSLNPVNKILPVAPPPLDSTMVLSGDCDVNRTVTLDGHSKGNETFKVPLTNQNRIVGDSVFVKPQARGSSLPRPVGASTGIPRATSRIPGPRSIRPATSKQAVNSTKPSGGYY